MLAAGLGLAALTGCHMHSKLSIDDGEPAGLTFESRNEETVVRQVVVRAQDMTILWEIAADQSVRAPTFSIRLGEVPPGFRQTVPETGPMGALAPGLELALMTYGETWPDAMSFLCHVDPGGRLQRGPSEGCRGGRYADPGVEPRWSPR